MRENTDQNNSEYIHFLRSDGVHLLNKGKAFLENSDIEFLRICPSQPAVQHSKFWNPFLAMFSFLGGMKWKHIFIKYDNL